MEPENYLKRNIKTYLEKGRTDSANGPSHIQRTCRIGYNQAVDTIEYGIEQGVLVRDSEKEWLHRIAPNTE